jgi:hypothetical protein
MPLQAQTAEKLAERLRSHPSFEAEHQPDFDTYKYI